MKKSIHLHSATICLIACLLTTMPAHSQSDNSTKQPPADNIKSTETKEIDFGPYMSNMQRRIKSMWHPPKENETKRAVVIFRIDTNGNMSDLHLDAPSKNPDVDKAALKAVVDASPFDALPKGAQPYVDIQFVFDYTVFHHDRQDFGNKDIDYGLYLANVQYRINSTWHAPQKIHHKVIVIFKVDSNGKMTDLHFKEASKDPHVNDAVLTAISDAAPFGPLPKGADPSIDIEFTFWGDRFSNSNDEANAYIQRGDSFYNLKQYEKAIDAYNKAYDLDSNIFCHGDLFSCGTIGPQHEYGLYGYIDKSGKQIIKPQFKFARPFSEGLAAVEIGNKTGFIDEHGNLVIKPKFSFVGDFHEGLALMLLGEWSYSQFSHIEGLVTTNPQYGFIDRSGQLTFRGLFPEYAFSADSHFSDGLVPIRVGNRCGYMDKSGSLAIRPIFESAGDFSRGTALVRLDNKWIEIDKTGQLVSANPSPRLQGAPNNELIPKPYIFPGANSFLKGMDCWYRKRYQQAIVHFSRAIQLKPTADAYIARAYSYEKLGQFRPATIDSSFAIALAKDNGDAYLCRAIAYAKLGKKALAIKDREKAKELGWVVSTQL